MRENPEHILKVCKIDFHNNGSEWYFVKCPFHAGDSDDPKNAKGRINPENGTYKCHRCGNPTSIWGYLSARLAQPIAAIKAAFEAATGEKGKIPNSLLVEWNQNLLSNAETLKKLRERHGITLDEVIKYNLGWNTVDERVQIPIKVDDVVVNVRRYSYIDKDNKLISYGKGYGGKQLYLRENIAANTDIYVTEGEFKAILLTRMGFAACAPTTGASTWDAKWNELFRGKHVVLVYDIDEPGRKGANQLTNSLFPVAASVRNVVLQDCADIKGGDITDYFVKLGKTADDFRKLVISTAPYEPPKAPKEAEDDPNVYDVSLADSSNAKYNRKRIRTQAVVSAKDTSPYIIPAKIQTVCDAAQPYCLHCHVSTNRGHKFSVEADDARVLKIINCTAKEQFDTLKAIGGIYPKCTACKFVTLESANVEELRLVPQIAVGHDSSEMVVRRVFAVGHGIETNQSYEITAKVCVEPDDQHATLVVYDYKKSHDDLSTFELSHNLDLFQPSEWTVEAVEAKLRDIYEDLEANVTKIYARRDLNMFFDLVFHSVLYIPFQGDNRRGYVDALCIGDSGQGKSEMSTRLSKHYRAGERIDCKGASPAGLVGGVQDADKRRFITWGTIPLNDKRLVLLEEVKGMAVESLAKLTEMRSSGIASISKIVQARTNARTRLCWISNARTDRELRTYNYGVDAVKELIGSLEDIRRFDMVMAVARGDVSLDIINASESDRTFVPHFYSSELCHHLVMWAWSRKESQVSVEKEAEDEILASATRMGETYSASIPIVSPSDQRIKLLKLSTALAARTFSTDDGSSVIVRRCHVEAVERFLNRIYGSAALGYFEYSASQNSENKLLNADELCKAVRDMPNASDSVKTIIDTDAIDVQTIIDITEWQKDRANSFIGFLVRSQAFRKLRRSGYRKTPAFTELLKKMDREGLANETLRMKMESSEL